MKLKSTIKREEIDNLGFFTSLSNFYIEKTLNVKKIKTELIEIKDSSYDDYLFVQINISLYNRFLKIYKISKNDKYFKLLEFINFLFKNKTEINDIFERYLSEELAKEIDRTILKELIKKGK